MLNLLSPKRLAAAAALIVVAALIFGGVTADRFARIISGYKAKIACSEIFVAGRDADTVLSEDFVNIDPAMDLVGAKVDHKNKSVRAAVYGLGRARAVYRDGYGCTLANGGRIKALNELAPAEAADPWPAAPRGSRGVAPWVDYEAIDAALTTAFEENHIGNRAVVVIVDGKLVDERYAKGFDAETPFLSWSMAKSVMATIIGAASLQGIVDVNEPAPAWKASDERANITWHDLMQMQSGLEFGEHYGQLRSDVNRMLFERADAGGLAAMRPASSPPGATWYYSSGTTNLLSRTLNEALKGADTNIYEFAYASIFDPIGAASITMEPDAAGAPIASSFIYATARDWARLGQLYLQDGVWNGKRLLQQGWAQYAGAPAAQSDNQYGAHFWLNRDGEGDRERFFPGLPETMYFFAGHEGQYVFIIPSKRAIIVRTGMTRGQPAMQSVRPLIEAIYDAIGSKNGSANGLAPMHEADHN